MATRSLTEVFILMRNNALQSRHIFSEQTADDRTSLMSSAHLDPEMGMASARSGALPPEWIDKLTEIQFEFTKIKEKMKELSSLHDKHLNRPTMDDSVDEEHEIEIRTQQITQMFSHCQRLVQQINNQSHRGSGHEQKLTQNIVASVARTMQEMSTNFRKSQSAYLRKIKSREERSQQYFGTHLNSDSNLLGDGIGGDQDIVYDKGFTTVQMQMVEDNTEFVQQREKEVASIVRSITELNEIFKDLASMIVDQGTILDRIDYNIDNAATQTEKGLVQLQKAEKYQKKNRKMMFILILAAVIVILLIIFIAVKS
ncbi:LOW QUALITY PROTEIN: syntaxin-16-like [Physella acuta]|uniref:LOW QUALITY PROTEIN: syntaxin-16-like n=1 Tax=Physella acuta TaxID=109671 RepID=UPI0027DB9E58|nr:LOW QUALITY PROTEIN: syntaxin-16-like [Physella acuta]